MFYFVKIVRHALKFRLTLAASFICSVMVGLFWGANIGTLYPFVDVVFNGESVSKSFDRKIEQAENKIDQLRESVKEMDRQLANGFLHQQVEAERNLTVCQGRLKAEQKALDKLLKWQPYVDKYLPKKPFNTMFMITGFLLCGTVLKGLFLAWNEILITRLVQRTIFDLRKQFYRATLQLDLANFQEDRTSKLMARFTHDLTRVGEGLSIVFGQAIREPFKMLFCLIGAAWISWRLLLLSLILTPLGIFAVRALALAVKRTSHESMNAMAELYARLAESFNGIMIVKAFTMEQHERRRFHLTSKNILRRIQQMAVLRAYLKPIAELTGVIIMCLGLLVGAYLVLNQETHLLGLKISSRPLSPASLFLFYGFLMGFTDPVKKLSGVSVTLHHTAAAAERVYKMMLREPRVKDPEDPKPLPQVPSELVFDDVGFRYGKGSRVLKRIGLRIQPGECVAFVGPNGCGKSTLVKMIPRFIDPLDGHVKLGEVDLREFRIRDLRRQIGIVTQTTRLFDDTVLNNIRYGATNATESQVIEAAEKAGAHEFIMEKLSDGYNTVVGEGGNTISGGQAQRIALARAILRDPAILILDEATSNIDAKSEIEIRETLKNFIHGRITVLVTHRHPMLRLANRIVVMHAGQIRDIGTHNELIARCSGYRHLYRHKLKKSA